MYQKPDFIKVSVKVKDVFASYNTSCPHDEMSMWVQPCLGTDGYVHMDYLEMGMGHQCYSVELP